MSGDDVERNKPFNSKPRGKYVDRDHGYRRELDDKPLQGAIRGWIFGRLRVRFPEVLDRCLNWSQREQLSDCSGMLPMTEKR
jgi:hypothetical protein